MSQLHSLTLIVLQYNFRPKDYHLQHLIDSLPVHTLQLQLTTVEYQGDGEPDSFVINCGHLHSLPLTHLTLDSIIVVGGGAAALARIAPQLRKLVADISNWASLTALSSLTSPRHLNHQRCWGWGS